MAEWFKPTLHIRSVVARDEPGMCQVRFQVSGPAMPPDFWVGVRVRVDVEGEQRGDDGFVFTYTEPGPHGGADQLHLSGAIPLPLEGLLAGFMDRELATIQVRATLRIQHRTGASQTDEFVGTEREVVFEEKTLILYDSFPAGYPVAVSDAVTDAAMREAFTPVSVMPNNWMEGGDPEPMLLLHYADSPQGPVPGCFELDLLSPDGTTTLAQAEGPYTRPGSGSQGFMLRFVPAEGLSPEDRQALDALNAGQTDTVRLRFRSSRETALKRPDVERYWGGTFTVDVPVDLLP